MHTLSQESINTKKIEIVNRFNKDYQTRKIDAEELKHLASIIQKRKQELVRLTLLSHKEISKYFMSFTPLECNIATFADLKLYGGPKIAINQNKLYIGTIVDGKRHGKGVIVSQKGKIYEGELLFNQRNGAGVQIYQNGNFYIGHFVNSKREGQGKMVWVNRSEDGNTTYQYYSGNWKQGSPHGFGLHEIEQWRFIGNFDNGIRNGKGIQVTRSRLFDGIYVNNERDSKGFYYEQDVQYYQGQFKNDKKNGYGKWKSLKQQQYYEGFFQDNLKVGIGLYRNHQFTYRGLFTDDQPSGTGQFNYHQKLPPKYKDNRIITELARKSNTKNPRGELQSAQFVRSKPNEFKPDVGIKGLQKILKKQNSMNLNEKKAETQRSSNKKVVRHTLSSARFPRASEQNPQRHLCSYKRCSCHKWQQNEAQKLKIDQNRILRLFSGRKTLLKNMI